MDEPGGVPVLNAPEADAALEIFTRRAAGESTGAIADWLDGKGHRTRKGRRFTSHAVKDILNCRFYVGVVTYKGDEFPGKHEAIISEELFLRVQARRQRRTFARRVHGESGVLQGMTSCVRCGRPIQVDRNRHGRPMYRERHSFECETNGRSLIAHVIDDQLAAVFASLELPENWREETARLAVQSENVIDVSQLLDRRKRIDRVYMDGRLTDSEYDVRLAEIDAQVRSTQPAEEPSAEEAAALLSDLPSLWRDATSDERRRLVRPLIERAYVNVEARRIAGIVPVPGLQTLLESAIRRSEHSECTLVSSDALVRDEGWTWWRRGRIELPVQ